MIDGAPPDPADDDSPDSATPTAQLDGELDSLASLLRDRAEPATLPVPVGTVVGGQYRIDGNLGAGGMGVVYLAHDLRLGRAVAIKLGAARSSALLARLQREASALASLSHPNVVVVHQIGEHDQRLFIAMEHVAGGTARQWLAAQRRSWSEIVTLYASAGDGLAAAHAAGLIHRDFKPDNVLVGDDGRPRVADFGLVRASACDDDGAREAGAPAVDVTRVGAILGTPAYMAPEQLRGDAVDARADQFSFCASLWEALHGQRPFPGTTPEQVEAAISSGPPVAGAGVVERAPRHVIEALRRGLRPRPDERWPTMTALLVALRHDPAVRRRRVALVLGGAALAAAIAVPLTMRVRRAPTPCTDGPSALAPTWNPERRARLAAKVGPTGWTALAPRLERYERGWLDGHRDACLATRRDRSPSADLLDRRMACLHRARASLAATLDLLDRSGAAARATAAVDGPPDLAACADTASLAAAAPLPTDPALRAQVEEATTLIATAHAAAYEDARPGTEELVARALAAARAGGWRPQIAEALGAQGSMLYDSDRIALAIPAFHEAAEQALAGGSDRIAVRMLCELAWSHAGHAAHDEASRALGLARALWERLGRPVPEARRVHNTAAFLSQSAGRHDEAVARLQELMAMIEAGQANGVAAADHYNLASALMAADRIDEGMPPLLRAIELSERDDGPDHANLGRYLALLAWAQRHRGEPVAAEVSARRALAIFEAWFGPEDSRLPYVLETLSEVLVDQGRIDEALPVFVRTAAVARAIGAAEAALGVEQRMAAVAAARSRSPRPAAP